MADISEEYATSGSGASETFPKQCSALRKNEHVMIKGKPCKIVDMSTSKTGKHGHAKVHMVGLDIFDNKKYEDICPSTHNMNVPKVSRQEYTVIEISDDGFLTIMNNNGDLTENIHAGGLADKIKKALDDDQGEVLVTVLSALGKEQAMSFKVATK